MMVFIEFIGGYWYS